MRKTWKMRGKRAVEKGNYELHNVKSGEMRESKFLERWIYASKTWIWLNLKETREKKRNKLNICVEKVKEAIEIDSQWQKWGDWLGSPESMIPSQSYGCQWLKATDRNRFRELQGAGDGRMLVIGFLFAVRTQPISQPALCTSSLWIDVYSCSWQVI